MTLPASLPAAPSEADETLKEASSLGGGAGARLGLERGSPCISFNFAGLPAYAHAPAAGLWKGEGETVCDDVVVYEVMVEELDRDWWRLNRAALRQAFGQNELVVRAQAVEALWLAFCLLPPHPTVSRAIG